MGEEALPATWQLGVLLAWLFLLFNQWLMFGTQAMLESRGSHVTADNFGIASLLIGLVVFLANAFFFILARAKGLVDVIALIGFFVLGQFFGISRESDALRLALGFSVFNLLTTLWLTRGLWVLAKSKKRQNN